MKKVAALLLVAGALLIGCSGGEAVTDKDAKGTEGAVTTAPNTGKVDPTAEPGTRSNSAVKGNVGGGRTGGAAPPVNMGGN